MRNKSLELSETYRHFDTLIWQVPSIGVAVGVGVVVGAAQIEKAPDAWVLSVAQLRGVVLLLGVMLLIALTVALFKYRIFSSAATPIALSRPPFGVWPSAGSALQLSMTLTTGTILGLSLAQMYGCSWIVFFCASLGVVASLVIECRLRHLVKAIDNQSETSTVG